MSAPVRLTQNGEVSRIGRSSTVREGIHRITEGTELPEGARVNKGGGNRTALWHGTVAQREWKYVWVFP